MVEMVPGDEPTAVLRKLIYAWCDRRCLEALKYVLPAYLSFNGLHGRGAASITRCAMSRHTPGMS